MSEREKISEELRWNIFKRDHYTCRYCGSKDGPFHLDHVYPVSKGGETSYENLVTACPTCNRIKRDAVGIWPEPIGLQRVRHMKSIGNHVFLFVITVSVISVYGAVLSIGNKEYAMFQADAVFNIAFAFSIIEILYWMYQFIKIKKGR